MAAILPARGTLAAKVPVTNPLGDHVGTTLLREPPYWRLT
jgi:hypothetical protein